MPERFARGVRRTIQTADRLRLFPKLVLPEGQPPIVAADRAELTPLLVLPTQTTVIEPDTEEMDLFFGTDFDTCVFLFDNEPNIVVFRRVPPPVLEGVPWRHFESSSPYIFWTAAFEVSTTIYRTPSIYRIAERDTSFIPIATVRGQDFPGNFGWFFDTSIIFPQEAGWAISYFVLNRHGMSNTVEIVPLQAF